MDLQVDGKLMGLKKTFVKKIGEKSVKKSVKIFTINIFLVGFRGLGFFV